MSAPKTLSEALCLIYTSPGVEYLTEPDRLLAVFIDIAPDLKAERAQLELLIKSGCVERLAGALGKPYSEAKPLILTSVDTLCNVYLMDRQKADVLCHTYVRALSGKPYTAEPPKKTNTGANNTNKSTGGSNKSNSGTKTGGSNKPNSSTNKTNSSTNKTGGAKTGGGANKTNGSTKTTTRNGQTVQIRGNKVTVTRPPQTPPPPAGCGTGMLMALITFVAVYAASLMGGFATPFLNALLVAVVVLTVSFFLPMGAKSSAPQTASQN